MKTFSINALGELLEKDRGLIVRALRGTAPDATEKNQPRYKMTTAIAALERHAGKNSNSGDSGISADLQKMFAMLDAVADKIRNATTVDKRRKIIRTEFFETLFATTAAMDASAKASNEDTNYSMLRIAEHERVQLMVLRQDCGWNADEMLSEYNSVTAHHFNAAGELID